MEFCEECGLLISREEYYDNYGLCDDCADYEDYLDWLSWREFLLSDY